MEDYHVLSDIQAKYNDWHAPAYYEQYSTQFVQECIQYAFNGEPSNHEIFALPEEVVTVNDLLNR